MKKIWVWVLLVFICIAAFIAFSSFPGVSSAPTTHGPGTSTSAAPENATLVDLIEVDQPFPNTTVASPLVISGKARGNWYFEATAPVELKDSSGTVVAHGTIRAQSDWMTTDYVAFIGRLTFTAPATHTGTLVLKNDNPSGNPKTQKELDIPVQF